MERTRRLTEVGVVEEVLVEQDNGGTESNPDTANWGVSGDFVFSMVSSNFCLAGYPR